MILKVLKEKSNQKFVEQTLLKRKPLILKEKLNSVGVLLNHSEFCNYKKIEELLLELGVSKEHYKIATYTTPKNPEVEKLKLPFTVKDFGWKGQLKNSELQDFTEFNFDVLICYFLENNSELSQIAAVSQANFKIGVTDKAERLFDLIINMKSLDFDVFRTELKRYLNILKKQ